MPTSHVITDDVVSSKPPMPLTHKGTDSSVTMYEENTPTEDDLLYPAPTAEEEKTLRKVSGSIPWVTWLLCLVEFAERASYYGAKQVFMNFMMNELPPGSRTGAVPPGDKTSSAGALNKGLQFAQAFVLLFNFFAYVFPIFGAWLGDTKIGRFPAIMLGVLICGVSHIIQVFGALPSVLSKGQGLAPFLFSLFLLAIGAGIFKPNILPTVLDQYTHQKAYTKVLKSGEKVIVDPEQTIQRISLWFYWSVNIGAFFGVPTSYAARLVGFWLAFLLPGIIYFLLPLVLLYVRNKLVKTPPQGNELNQFFSIVKTALSQNRWNVFKGGNFWNAAKPSVLAAKGITTYKKKPIEWNDKLVDDVKRTLKACTMFLYFPIWILNDGGIGGIAASQASSMRTDGVPNDLLSNFNPLTIMIFVPLLSHVIYPALQKARMMPGRVTRITFGFTLASISSVIGALLQYHIYKTSPCGWHATKCKVGTKVSPLSVWAQSPIFILGAISECFCQVTAYEIAYARSPKNMKAVVMSFFLFMNAFSSAIAQIVTPVTKDPYLIWIWAGPAMSLFVLTIHFYWNYRWMNNDEFMTYEEEYVQGGEHKDSGNAVKDDKKV